MAVALPNFGLQNETLALKTKRRSSKLNFDPLITVSVVEIITHEKPVSQFWATYAILKRINVSYHLQLACLEVYFALNPCLRRILAKKRAAISPISLLVNY
jgi:hypothetical protein